MTAFRLLAERGLELVKDADNSNRRWLEEQRDMYTFFELQLPTLLERWERENPKKHTR